MADHKKCECKRFEFQCHRPVKRVVVRGTKTKPLGNENLEDLQALCGICYKHNSREDLNYSNTCCMGEREAKWKQEKKKEKRDALDFFFRALLIFIICPIAIAAFGEKNNWITYLVFVVAMPALVVSRSYFIKDMWKDWAKDIRKSWFEFLENVIFTLLLTVPLIAMLTLTFFFVLW